MNSCTMMIYISILKTQETLLYKVLVFILWENGIVKLQNREEEDVKYTPFIWKWKPCTRFSFYQVPHFGCPLPLHNGMNSEQQLCFYLKKILKDHWDSHVSFHQHENVNFWAALRVKPDLGPLFNVHSNLPSFIPDRERRGGGRRRTSSQNLKLPRGTICFHGTKHWLRINNKRFTKFSYLLCCSTRDPSSWSGCPGQAGQGTAGHGLWLTPKSHSCFPHQGWEKTHPYTSWAGPARVCVITFFNNREAAEHGHHTLKINH